MPEITWETIVGALALVALVAGAQYVRTSGSLGGAVVAQGKDVVGEVKSKVSGGKKKKKGKKAAAPVQIQTEELQQETEASVEPVPSAQTSGGGSYADVAQAAVKQDAVGHEDVVVPASGAGKAGKRKKNKAKAVVEPAPQAAATATPPPPEPSQPDTSNDASLAAALSAEEPSSSSSSSSEAESEPSAQPTTKRNPGGWEKPKKPIGGSTNDSSAWESSAPRTTGSGPTNSITSANRFSALSVSLPPTTAHKKPLPRTSTTGTGKHRAEESSSMTKLQKKNAAAASAKKAAKEAEEKERLERLARYRREQEREKVSALRSGPKQGGSSKITVAANNRSLSNGMNASVDSGGKLVWD